MKSIKIKLGALVLLCVLLVAVTIGITSIQSSKKAMTESSTQLMQEQGSGKAETINALLSRIEQSVVTLSDYALIELDDIVKFKTDKEYVKAYSEKMSEVAINAANNTEGAMAVYLRFNPEYTESTSGLFASRETAGGEFKKLVPTDFSMYDPSDTAHVGWYYVPVQNGKPTWMAPYLNENLNVNMISYVIPLSVNGVSVGVIGMDIDFGIIQTLVDNTHLYESGYAFLVNSSKEDVYRPSGIAQSTGNWEYQEMSLKNDMTLTLAAPTDEIHAEANKLTLQITLLSIAGAIFALVISSFVIGGIAKPLRELNRVAGKIAEGELDVSVSSKSKDEVGMLAVSFGKIVSRLQTYIVYIQETSAVLKQISDGNLVVDLQNDYSGEFSHVKEALLGISAKLNQDMEQIKTASHQIEVGSEQVAKGAQILSQGTSQQTSAIDELSNAIHALSEKIKANANGARTVNELAGQAGVDLQHNAAQMSGMVAAMDTISKSGEEIIARTKAIDDIAMQTNILAINASIEAARAGTAGRGFSIVAEEVKKLALKSAGVAETISSLIEKTVDAIANGTQIANVTEQSVLDTATNAKAVVDIVQQIVADSDEQSYTVEQIIESMDKITSVIQQASAASEEGAASAEELSGQAQMMSGLVDKFQLDDRIEY